MTLSLRQPIFVLQSSAVYCNFEWSKINKLHVEQAEWYITKSKVLILGRLGHKSPLLLPCSCLQEKILTF